MTITEHPEFRRIMETAYAKAFADGVEAERERCAKIAERRFAEMLGEAYSGERTVCRWIADDIRGGK